MSQDREKAKENNDEQWVTLGTFSNRMEAEVIVGLLQSCGIPSRVNADDVGGLRPHLAKTLGVQLLVRGADFDQANAIVMA